MCYYKIGHSPGQRLPLNIRRIEMSKRGEPVVSHIPRTWYNQEHSDFDTLSHIDLENDHPRTPIHAKCLPCKDSKYYINQENKISSQLYLNHFKLVVFVVVFLRQCPCSFRIYICNFSTSPLAHTTPPVKFHTTTCSVAGPVIRSDRSDGYDGSIQCPASVGALCTLYLCVPPSILTPLRGVSLLAPLYHLPSSGVSMPAISSNVTPPHMYFPFCYPSGQSQQAI